MTKTIDDSMYLDRAAAAKVLGLDEDEMLLEERQWRGIKPAFHRHGQPVYIRRAVELRRDALRAERTSFAH